MKKLFLRFALLTGLFLVGFAAPALADEKDVYLDLTLKISEYTGSEGGQVAMSNQNDDPSPISGWLTECNKRIASTKRGKTTYNEVTIYAKPNEGYTFSYWAEADSKTAKPVAASTDEKMIYDGNWGYYIKRWLHDNPGSWNVTEEAYTALFRYHVYGTFIDYHRDKYTLYAVFEPNQYTVTFKDGVTEVLTPKTVTYNEIYGALPNYEKDGYTFEGWYDNAECTGTAVTANTTYATVGNSVLYAKCTPIEYTIRFVDQEQSQSFADATYRGTTMPTLSASLPTDGGYLPVVPDKYFAGFYTKPNGQGDRVYAGYADGGNLKLLQSLTLSSNITLYAHYSHTHHNMYWDYSYNNGSWNNLNPAEYLKYARLTFKKANGDLIKSVILEAIAPTAHGTVGDDFSTHLTSLANINLAVGTATDVLDVENVKVYFTDEQLAAFAAYTFEAISVTAADPKDATVATNWAVTVDKDDHHTVLNYIGATEGNVYQQKWSVELNGLLVNPDYIYVMPLYWDGSKWAAISQLTHTYGVQCIKSNETDIDTEGHKKATYAGSYSVWIKSNSDQYYNYAVGLVGFNLGGKNFFMNTTYPGTFSEFYNSATAATPFVANPGTNTSATPDVTINYTVPASKIPVIHFLPGATDAQLGAETPEFLVKAYEEQIADLAASYTATRPGYTFQGWKESNGTAISKPMIVDRAYTVEAQWEGAPYTVTLYDNGGEGGLTSVTAKYMEDMPTLTTLPTRTGYDFNGYLDITNTYYYNADGTSAKQYDKMANSDMWAQWQAQTYTVTLDHNDGTSTPETVTATYGEPMADVTVPTWYGHAFLGYFDGEEATATKYIDAEGHCIHAWDKATDATLYAHWETVEITITANKDPLHPSDYYTTFYLSSVAYQITTPNVTIFIATRATDGKLYLEEVAGDVIPADEAVLLQATQSDIHLAPVESTLLKNENNIFEGVDEETAQAENYTYYVFGVDNTNVVGFYQYEWEDNGATVKGELKAHKAFFKAAKGSQQASAPRYVIHHTDVTTGMEAATMEKAAVRKMIVNGQLVIEREGKLYNAQGVVIK